MVDDDESITIDVTEHPVTDEQKAGWEMSYCDKHQVYWVLDEGSCPSCERGAKPISYGKDRNGGVRAIYIHGVEVVGAVLSSEAVDLVDRVNALLRVYDAEIQHALGSVRLLGDERDTLRAENERLREVLRRLADASETVIGSDHDMPGTAAEVLEYGDALTDARAALKEGT